QLQPVVLWQKSVNAIAQDGAYLVNYRTFNNPAFVADPFVRDPERLGIRDTNGNRGAYVGGFNVPYTYPDHNNFYLGLLDPNTGAIVSPSFHREYLFGKFNLPAYVPGGVPFGTYNPNWLNKEGKYFT